MRRDERLEVLFGATEGLSVVFGMARERAMLASVGLINDGAMSNRRRGEAERIEEEGDREESDKSGRLLEL